MIVNCKGMKGSLEIICSKSMAQRYMLCCYLAGEIDEALNIEERIGILSDDTRAMRDCIEALSCPDHPAFLRCRESGTTLRTIMPIAAAQGRDVVILLEGSLASRPIAALEDELVDHGAVIRDEGSTIYVSGQIDTGEYRMSGHVSSQYTSGLLFALAALGGGGEVYVDTRPQSLPYIEMTIKALEMFGVKVNTSTRGRGLAFEMPAGQKLTWTKKTRELLEGDWSNGAMWLAANQLLGNTLKLSGLSNDSLQGDKMIASILSLYERNDRKTISIDVGDTPDIVPAIALVALTSSARTIITNAGRLRYKESDRLATISRMLTDLGATVHEGLAELEIEGSNGMLLSGTDEIINTESDHRMAMLAAFASIVCKKPVRMDHPESVKKSYPMFFEEIVKLGGSVVNEDDC